MVDDVSHEQKRTHLFHLQSVPQLRLLELAVAIVHLAVFVIVINIITIVFFIVVIVFFVIFVFFIVIVAISLQPLADAPLEDDALVGRPCLACDPR
jgi:uncharacterized membrane protein